MLDQFQVDFVRDIYEPHHWVVVEGVSRLRRVVRRAILSIARKNGKTALIAALVLAHLVGPEAVRNGEIYSAANDREQAAQIYKCAAQIVRADRELDAAQGGLLRCIDSTKNISCYSNGSFYRALSKESGTKHGLNPTFWVYDELSQAASRELFDVLDTSGGARAEPLGCVISTQSNDPEHILSKMIDDGLSADDPTIVCHLYEVPEDDDVFDEVSWPKANPALGSFRSVEDMRSLARKAERSPGDEPKFRNLYCNQRVSSISSMFSKKEWMACVGDASFAPRTPKEEVYLALDLASVNDLCALVMGSAGDKTKLKCFAWKPKDLLEEHSDRDFGKRSRRYVQWAAEPNRYLLTSPGKTIQPRTVATKIAELHGQYKILGLAYDRWRINELLNVFDEIGLEAWIDKGSDEDRRTHSGLRMVPWGQGWHDMGPAVDAMEREIIDRTLVHDDNPLFNWTIANAVSETDAAGSRKPTKEKARFRIDPAVAAVMLFGLKSRDRMAKKKPVQMMII